MKISELIFELKELKYCFKFFASSGVIFFGSTDEFCEKEKKKKNKKNNKCFILKFE